MGRRTIKRKSGRQMVHGNGCLVDEISCIEEEAAAHDVRMATIGQLIPFSTDTGRCWLLYATNDLATALARNRDQEAIRLEGTDTSFAIGLKGHYRIEGASSPIATRPRRDHPRLPASKITQAD